MKIRINMDENTNTLEGKIQKGLDDVLKGSNRKGGKVVSRGLITYSYMLEFNNVSYYINMELANGNNKFKLMSILKHYKSIGINSLEEMEKAINISGFSHKVIDYDDINFIYVFNNNCRELFDEN